MKSQMIRVISSPSSSTTGFATLIFAISSLVNAQSKTGRRATCTLRTCLPHNACRRNGEERATRKAVFIRASLVCPGSGVRSRLAHHDDMHPARAVRAQKQGLLDIAGARRAGDVVHRARHHTLAVGGAQALPHG